MAASHHIPLQGMRSVKCSHACSNWRAHAALLIMMVNAGELLGIMVMQGSEVWHGTQIHEVRSWASRWQPRLHLIRASRRFRMLLKQHRADCTRMQACVTRNGFSFTSRAFGGDAAGAGGRAIACHARQAQDGLLIWHQRVQDLLREAAQRLGRGSGCALLRLHSTKTPQFSGFPVTAVQGFKLWH